MPGDFALVPVVDSWLMSNLSAWQFLQSWCCQEDVVQEHHPDCCPSSAVALHQVTATQRLRWPAAASGLEGLMMLGGDHPVQGRSHHCLTNAREGQQV